MMRSIVAILAAMCACTVRCDAQVAARTTLAPTSASDTVEAIVDAVVEGLWQASDAHWHKGEYCHFVNLTRMVVKARPSHINGYADAGWLLWSMDRDAEALELYDQGIAANPKTYAMYYEKGFYYINRRKDWKSGVPLLEKAVAQPDCPKIVLHTLAHAYERIGQLPKALDAWDRAAEDASNPGRAAARVNRERVRRLMAERK